MNKIYYLSSCSTCVRIIRELKLKERYFEFRDIKKTKITSLELDALWKMAGSCELLFSKVAMKYKEIDIDKRPVLENDFRQHILDEYTFLKRPVIIVGNKIFVGNSKNTIAEVAMELQHLI